MLSEKEKKRRQHEKELKSLRNKMGNSIVWFDALNKTQQYDVLFRWKREKNSNKLTKPEKKTIFKRVSGFNNGRYQVLKKEIEVISYPPNFKYFLKNIKPFFSVSVSKMRESQLKHLLN
jgi:hypothetical protein